MNSSGIKRGLATAAVSALAVTGLPGLVGSASATPLGSAGESTAVQIFSQASGNASTKGDGVNSTVHLVAAAGTDVKQIRFQYKVAGGSAQPIAAVNRVNGGFSHEWAPPANVLGAAVTIEAIGLDAAGAAISETSQDAKSVTLGAGSEAVDITNAAGSEIGVFEEPYSGNETLLAAVSGTTSSSAAPSVGSPSGADNATTADVFESTGAVRKFSGIADVTGYEWSTPVTVNGVTSTPADEAVVVADAGSDDAELVKLYQQTITTVTAKATPELVQSPATADATVTVLDQKGKPIAGARVGQIGGDTELTNSAGQAVFTELDGSDEGESYEFYVDATSTAGYQSADDFKKTVTVKSYTAVVTSIEATSADGAAFDFDENESGDIKVSAKDQNGAATAPTGVIGTWTVKPFDADEDEVTSAAAIDGDGNVALPAGGPAGTYTLKTWIEKDGTPGQGAGDLSAASLSVKAGEASITWDPKFSQAQAGTTATQKGVLTLSDKTVLGGRTAAVTLATDGDATFAANQPADVTRDNDTEVTVKTAADGTFSVAVADVPAVAPLPQFSELNVRLDASSAALDITAADTDDLLLDFVDLGVKTVDIDGAQLFEEGATPGRPVSYTVSVRNKDGDLLKNTPVELSLDHGFFTTYAVAADDLTPATAPTVGGLYGVWKNEGTSKSLSTGADGRVTVTVAIGRDAGFDDDGMVDAKLTVKAGAVTETGVTEFDSSDPLNPGEATVGFSADQTPSLPKAQVGTNVLLDVFVNDQFGNLTDAQVDLSDGSSDADVEDTDTGSDTETRGQFTDEQPRLRADSESAMSQSIKIDWTGAQTNVWKDGDLVEPGVQGELVSATAEASVSDDTKKIEWYAIDYAASRYALTSNAQGVQATGATVIVTYTALDQNGNPIVGAPVSLFRSGPDDLQDGNSTPRSTDASGVVRYIFQGAKPGTATVTAVLSTSSNSPIAASTKEVKIVFATPTTPPVVTPPAPTPASIVAKLLGSSNGKKADRVTVNGPSSAKGARVVLYRVVDGKRKRVANGTLNRAGNKTFTVRDRNGGKSTKYVAIVASTKQTKRDTTNTKTVK